MDIFIVFGMLFGGERKLPTVKREFSLIVQILLMTSFCSKFYYVVLPISFVKLNLHFNTTIAENNDAITVLSLTTLLYPRCSTKYYNRTIFIMYNIIPFTLSFCHSAFLKRIFTPLTMTLYDTFYQHTLATATAYTPLRTLTCLIHRPPS